MITLDLVDRTKDATEESIELVRSFIEEDTHLNYDDLKVETMLSRGAPSMIVKKSYFKISRWYLINWPLTRSKEKLGFIVGRLIRRFLIPTGLCLGGGGKSPKPL